MHSSISASALKSKLSVMDRLSDAQTLASAASSVCKDSPLASMLLLSVVCLLTECINDLETEVV